MLTEHELRMVMAAADGELPTEQAVAFLRLCEARPEAVRLFKRLQADTARLKAAPRVKAPADTAAKVLARIAPLPHATPKTLTPARRTPRVPTWLPYAAAASVMLAASAGTVVLFQQQTARAREQAYTTLLPTDPPPTVVPQPDLAVLAGVKTNPPLDADAVAKGGPIDDLGGQPDQLTANPKAGTPNAVRTPDDAFGSGQMQPSQPLVTVDLRLPLLMPAEEFMHDEAKARAARELARDPAFRIDLFGKNPAAAWEATLAAAKQCGIPLTVDATAQERLNQKLSGVVYALLIDGLTPAEAADLLAEVGKQAAAKAKPETAFASAHFIPMSAADLKDVKELTGIDMMPKAAKPAGGDPRPLSADTIGQVTAAVKKPGEKAAVMTTFLPANGRVNPAKSAEVKAFADKHAERKAGTVPLLLVVR